LKLIYSRQLCIVVMRTDELSQKVGLTYLLPVEQGWRWSDCERWQATAADTVDRLSVVNVPRLLISTDAHYCRLAVRGYQLQSIHFAESQLHKPMRPTLL